jgi:RNA polymerase sigma-70 factor (ECF subfamily)
MDAAEAPTILSRARRGDGEAFKALVEGHSLRLFKLAFRMTGNEQDAEDIVQDSFLSAYRQIGRFEARANFGTWIYRIVANRSLDVLRLRKSRGAETRAMPLDRVIEQPAAHDPSPERLAGSAEIEWRIKRALDNLTPLERAAFTLRHHEGCSIDEIGRTLGLSTSAAKDSVFRAVRKLRLALEPLRE